MLCIQNLVRSLFTLIIVFLLCPTLYAKAPSCSSLFENRFKINKTEFIIIAEKGEYTNVQTENMIKAQVQEMMSNLFPQLQLPEKIEIHLSAETNSPYMMSTSQSNVWVIGVGESYFLSPQLLYSKHPKHLAPIFAHEFGHIPFNIKLLKKYPELTNYEYFNFKYTESRNLYIQLSREASNLPVSKYATEAEFEKAYIEIRNRSTKALKDMNGYSAMIDLSIELFANKKLLALKKTYDELFADVISVLYTSDPHAMRDALNFTVPWNHLLQAKVDGDLPTTPPTALELKRRIKRISNLKSQQSISANNRDFEPARLTPQENYDLAEMKGYHGVFAETRQFLWERYLKNSKYQNQKDQVAKVMLEVFFSEIDYYYLQILHPTNNKEVKSLNVKEMNSRLQLALDTALSQI